MAKPKHPILNEYNLLKESFNQNPLASAVTDIIINIHNECQNELKSKQKHNLNPGNGTIGKTYFYFSDDKKHSRPVNQALFEDGYQPATDFSGNLVKNQEGLTMTKADWFLHNLKNNAIKNQSADDFQSAGKHRNPCIAHSLNAVSKYHQKSQEKDENSHNQQILSAQLKY